MESLFAQCIQQVVARFGKGAPIDWPPRYFDKLSQAISQRSHIVISAHTLKRLMGRVKIHEEYDPQDSTKNALAKYLGFNDWDHYIDLKGQIGGVIHKENELNYTVTGKKYRPVFIVSLILIILLLAIVYRFRFLESLSEIVVNSSVGRYPHTAVFNYRAGNHVVMDFGDFRTEPLKQKAGSITHSYLFPDYFPAKLIKKNRVLKTAFVQVLSDGWFADVTYRDELTQKQLLYQVKNFRDTVNGILFIPAETVYELGIPRKQDYWTEFRNIRDFNTVVDDCSVTFIVKNNEQDGGIRCFDFIFKLIGEHGICEVRFLHPGCIQFIDMTISEKRWKGSETNLSDFGRQITGWTSIEMAIRDKNAVIFFNNDTVFQTSYNQPAGKVKGLIMVFKGSGMADKIELRNKDGIIVFSDNFKD